VAKRILGRLVRLVKVCAFFAPLLLLWLPGTLKAVLLVGTACLLAVLSSLQRLPFLRGGRWQVVREPGSSRRLKQRRKQ
jgi:hypothetical protein